jgi:hypothetical protein
VIGYSGKTEFVNFHMNVHGDKLGDGRIDDNEAARFKQHRQPITTTKAREISGFSANTAGWAFIAGCGALGARIALNLAKSGSLQLVLCDPAFFSPHNFLRHPLSAIYNGQNKAQALAKEIRKIYGGSAPNLYSSHKSAQIIFSISEEAGYFDWLYDLTASPAFLNDLIKGALSPNTRIAKGYITDFGNRSILLFEGSNRNPRVDDLQALLYAKSFSDDEISNWLSREAAATGAAFINVGVGCHTETTVLSNDYVDLHASLMSAGIKLESLTPASELGKVHVHSVQRTPVFSSKPSEFRFNPVSVLHARNAPEWEIRIASGLVERIQEQMRAAAPSETGGVFVGCANYKTNTIHVVDLIDAPPDSRANEVCFIRGKDNLPEQVQHINDRSGGQLGYIGEWHSHPDGPEGMSPRDYATAMGFLNDYHKLTAPLPVFLLIVTPNQLLPYVFD